MNRNFFRAMAVFGIVALAACSGGSMGHTALPSTPDGMQPAAGSVSDALLGPANGFYPMAHPGSVRALCPASARPGAMHCDALMRTDLGVVGLMSPDKIPPNTGYGPADIQSAYHLDATAGGGQTVAIVDAFGYKTAASDLAIYRKAAGLPACSVSSGCLRIVNENGGSSLPPQDNGWAGEQSLDLDAVSAACPKCKILLVQASQAQSTNLYTGVATAAKMGANAISNSYGGGEGGASAPPEFNQPGHVIVASAGDNGGGVQPAGRSGPQMPCTYANVVCVGGTRLTHGGSSWSEVAWNDINSSFGNAGATGSGCSKQVPKPSWQTDTGCKKRSESDVSAVASPFTPLAVYNTVFKAEYGSPWQGFGGTSLSSPLIAAMFALAGNSSSRHGAMEIWQNHSALTDVTMGNNIYSPVTGKCASSVKYICIAGPGYDGPTGWGSPNGVGAL